MTLRPLLPLLRDEPALLKVLGRSSAVLAVPDPARAYTIAGVAELSQRRPIVVCVPTTADAERLRSDLQTFLGDDAVDLFPAWETLPFERVSPNVETMGQRLRTLWHMRDPERAPRVIVAPVRALVQRLGPHVVDIEPVIVGVGDQIDPAELVERLVVQGYRREYQVEHRGEVAVRGSIVDVFPSTGDVPIRIDLWGDEVDRLTEFSVADQRSTIDVSEVEIFPARELLPTDEVKERAAALVAKEPWGREHWERFAEGLTFDGMESWLPWLVGDDEVLLDLLDPTAQILLVEPRRMRDRAADIDAEERDLASTLARTWGAAAADEAAEGRFPSLHLPFDRLLARTDAPAWTVTTAPEGPDVATVASAGWDPVVGDGQRLVDQIRGLLGEGYRVVVGADGAGSAERLHNLMADQGIDLRRAEPDDDALMRPGAHLVVAPLERGFILPSVQLAVLCERDLTGRRRAHRAARPRRRDAQAFFDDLKPGDHVVHHQHGVARYAGMVKRAIGGVERDYLLLEYRGADKLYIPSDQIDTVRHYTGGDSPSLSRLGGGDWQKTKARVRSAVQEIAQELVVLYQKRLNTPGHSFAEDTPWQRELEEAFPYQETPDQLQAITEVKADMEAEVPMDRLVCGDVGFGKTEVALRAVFKAVQDGKQAAVLVPTTLLAQQHFQTFSERFAGFPIRVEVLSRFLTAGQAKKVTEGLRSGEIDVVIGTHRLLAEGLQFKDLGLLVVDEEQRFGVSHKEQIKQLDAGVDVLTLSATPIPRTLEMSLTGIRDLTLLNTPPAARQPILTYVGEYDERAVAEAIRRELLREGQVFFVHNRVQDIDRVAEGLRELVPEARIAIAHGQMDEGSLEKVVLDFWEGEFDVLVCTTIIESGIDMPTVNTLVVDRADLLGLGQLHQLRGRVGRAGQRAYAYLFTPRDRVLTEETYERLKTIGEATELGSGFKIAMRDLEIRGAGNLLGTGQSGHIAAVGYDLYCQMVTEAVAELKGETPKEPAEIKIDLPLPASLPTTYVGKEELRLEAYRRLAAVDAEEQVSDIRAEWEDRYGPIPPEAENLLAVARLRAECARVGVREVVVTTGSGFGGPKHVARLQPLPLLLSQQLKLKRLFQGSVYKEDIEQVQVGIKGGTDLVDAIVLFLRTIVPA
ncbi:transcription-repair coupling factor [Actinomarinicola tropica]|uniref:Transcription-repair-coupling factor n=1 Tax=Actinomarinicola tropica TaxID=2789776 RepID=A0A5Q2RS32_9ACTN|nr:transcription-repair coupling factor [Actinomarinicola tropica]QGG96005.1 transcription-repair coupling factor [Actinomarinicola tropica]